ncbi:MAG: response regulator [Halioglobus sp.]
MLIRIYVEDDGIGMDIPTQKRVFDPFTQADASTTREYGGTGLGLSISRHYIDMMGGEIQIQSALNEGTKLILSIPMKGVISKDSVNRKFSQSDTNIYTGNYYTFQMISSHLSRFGMQSNRVLRDEWTSFKISSDSIFIFDYDKLDFSADIDSLLKNCKATTRIVLTPLTGEKLPAVFADWIAISKPITSKILREALDANLSEPKISMQDKLNFPNQGNSERLQILVAEDVVTNQQIILEMLRLLGHEVDIANNGELAVEKYAAGNCDLIFLDCQMPTMDGYEATRKIRKLEEYNRRRKPVPIIALTAGSDKEDKRRCRLAGEWIPYKTILHIRYPGNNSTALTCGKS